MHKDLEALLAVQSDDAGLRELDERAAALDVRERSLEAELAAVRAAAERSRGALEREEARYRALETKVVQHRQLQQRNVAQLDQVRKLREATAAQAQVDMARQILADEERELASIGRRLDDLRQALEGHEMQIAEREAAQAEQRGEVAAARAALEEEREQARQKRASAAQGVPRSLLTRYERIRDRRRGEAVFPVRGMACGNCDTAIPLQRRNLMADGSIIEVCEVCGVLLYATPV